MGLCCRSTFAIVRPSQEKSIRPPSMRKLYLLFIGIIVLGVVAFVVLRTGPAPTIVIEPAAQAIGQKTPVTVRVSEPKRGLSTIKVELVQGDLVRSLTEKTHEPASAWAPWRTGTSDEELHVEVGKDAVTRTTAVPGLSSATASFPTSSPVLRSCV